MFYLIIEYFEDISDWLWFEYFYVVQWWGDKFIFINVCEDERERLVKFGSVIIESVMKFFFDCLKFIVFDFQVEEELKFEDIEEDIMIVVGGIFGDVVLCGRMREFIILKMEGVKVRYIGKFQYLIDGVLIVVKFIVDGKWLEEIEYEEYFMIKFDEFSEIMFYYVVLKLDGKFFLMLGFIDFQKREFGYIEVDDEISDEELIEFFEGKREF